MSDTIRHALKPLYDHEAHRNPANPYHIPFDNHGLLDRNHRNYPDLSLKQILQAKEIRRLHQERTLNKPHLPPCGKRITRKLKEFHDSYLPYKGTAYHEEQVRAEAYQEGLEAGAAATAQLAHQHNGFSESEDERQRRLDLIGITTKRHAPRQFGEDPDRLTRTQQRRAMAGSYIPGTPKQSPVPKDCNRDDPLFRRCDLEPRPNNWLHSNAR